MPEIESIIRTTEKFSARNYAPLPVVITRGAGSWVFDVDGRRYLDCISAYSSLNQGHCHPRIIEALSTQARQLTLTSRAVHNERMGPFLAKLCMLADFEQALPMNTGAEAVESAIKLARKWAYTRKQVPRDRARIIVCANNFHGRTSTIVGFSTEPQYRDQFGPYSDCFDIIPFDDPEALERAITKNTAAFLVEPIQAEAGIVMPRQGFLTAARDICDEHGVLLMLDEIQTGLGRTGRMFAYEHEEHAKPDVLILGKALGGGVYPVSAVLASRAVMSVFEPGDHGSTFGGNPLACAAAEAAIDVIVDEHLAGRAKENGARLRSGIERISSPLLEDVRGCGLLLGLELKESAGTARQFAESLLEHGVLAKDTHRQVVRLAPPLVVEPQEIDWLLERLVAVLA